MSVDFGSSQAGDVSIPGGVAGGDIHYQVDPQVLAFVRDLLHDSIQQLDRANAELGELLRRINDKADLYQVSARQADAALAQADSALLVRVVRLEQAYLGLLIFAMFGFLSIGAFLAWAVL